MVASSRTSIARSGSHVTFNLRGCDLLGFNPMFDHPAAEGSNQADLQYCRAVRIAFRAYLGRIGINVLAQRSLAHAEDGLGLFEKQVHQCSPSTTACQENIDQTMPGKSLPAHGL